MQKESLLFFSFPSESTLFYIHKFAEKKAPLLSPFQGGAGGGLEGFGVGFLRHTAGNAQRSSYCRQNGNHCLNDKFPNVFLCCCLNESHLSVYPTIPFEV
jgi:hypothetical protein